MSSSVPPSRTGLPAAANSIGDAESGNEGLTGDQDVAKDLFALGIMRDRGLIDEATYRTRCDALQKTKNGS